MNKKVEYYQLVSDHQGLCAVQWPDGSAVYAAKHVHYRVCETDSKSYVFFADDLFIAHADVTDFMRHLMEGKLTCVLVDLQSASNPISLRKPAINARRKN